jgi:hypothetical protein
MEETGCLKAVCLTHNAGGGWPLQALSILQLYFLFSVAYISSGSLYFG